MKLLRPNGTPANLVTKTQFMHEWVHARVAEGWDIADGGRGKPSFPADKDALKAMQAALAKLGRGAGKVSPYGTSPLGEPDYRLQAAQGLTQEYGHGLDFKREEIAFTPGGQFGLAAAFYAVEQEHPGGVIIAPLPWYLNHRELAGMFSGTKLSAQPSHRPEKFWPVDVLKEPDHRLTASALEKSILAAKKSGKKIQAFLFCNPMNPLGVVTRYEEWRDIARVLKKHSAPIILDEAFAEIIFDHDATWSLLQAAPELKDRTFLFRSGTKALGLPGERLAVMTIPKKYRAHVVALSSRMLGNAALSLQAGMAAALTTMTAAKKKKITQHYRKHRDFMVHEMKKLGILVHEPEGGFYLLIDLKKLLTTKLKTDLDLCLALLNGYRLPKKTGLCLMPGSAFGLSPKAGICRVSYSSHWDEVQKIAGRISAVFNA